MGNVTAEALVLREAKQGATFDDLRYRVYWDPEANYQALLGNIEGGNGYVPLHFQDIEAAELAVRSVLPYIASDRQNALVASWTAKREHLSQVERAANKHSVARRAVHRLTRYK